VQLYVLLCLFFYSAVYSKQIGFKAIAGNREAVAKPQGIAGRAQRAHYNLIENLVPYAVVILVAHVQQVSNFYTVSAALVFLAARLTHALSYIMGIAGVRTLAWNAGVIATILIGVQVAIK
jgi:uncharacterized MAPEG superfamily protein